MSFFPPSSETPKKPRELIPAATHEAYCYGVVDMGTQERKPYKGTPKEPQRALMMFFEFTEQLRQFKDEGPMEPMVKSHRMSYFTDEKSTLAKLCMAWLGKKVADVDFGALAGQPASITIAHEASATDATKIYDNMTVISPLSEKLVPLMPPMHNKPMNFSITVHGFDSQEFKDLYPWVRTEIEKSAEYKEFINGPENLDAAMGHEGDPPADDLPFS
jgi:hypothetical protein